MVVGTRAQVYHGTATETSGGLSKKDLFMDTDGEIKSVKKSKLMMKRTKEGTNPLAPFIVKALEGSAKAKSGFKKVPKKGTTAYKKLMK
tara:strand:- start:541 stop:807 length:267 start_codon:yes stop_codon:yes gene_type:complete